MDRCIRLYYRYKYIGFILWVIVMDIQAKLDAIQEQKQTLLEMTPAQHRSNHLTKLYAEVVDAKSTAKNAPFRVKAAEEKYYRVRDGENGYQEYLLERYSKERRGLRDRMLSRHKSQMGEVNQSLSYYESVRTYLRNIADIQTVLLKQIRTLLNKIRMSEVETTYRKSYFIEQIQTALNTRILICNLCILTYVGIMSYTRGLQDPWVARSMIGLLVIVFGLSHLIHGIRQIPLSLNVYTEVGYDPIESKKQWYFIIPVSMILLWVFVRYA
jgi:hypothetical protein